METTTCDKCNKEIVLGAWPFCPHSTDGHYGITTDDIPGGVLIRNGICEDDGSPKRYYTKSSIHAAAKAKGLINRVEHITSEGTDKNPHTTRWI